MQQFLVVILRLACMTAALLGIAQLYRATLSSSSPPTVFDTVYAQCIVILVSLAYYCVAKFCLAACFPAKRRPRRVSLVPRDADGNYLDMQLTSVVELVRGAPKLTIANVWILVYGVGFILFVVGYCVLALNPLCLACLGLGMSTLAIDELVCPRHIMSKLYSSARSAALLASLVSLGLVSSELFNEELLAFASALDLYSLGFGICLPIVAQFLMVAVRDCRRYSPGPAVGGGGFGLAFKAFRGVFHPRGAYGQRFQQVHAGGEEQAQRWYDRLAARMDGPFLLFHTLAPLLVCPYLVAYVACVLEGTAVDPFLAATLSLCVHYVLEEPASALGIYGTLCCGVAIVVRVLSEYTPRLRDWRLQAEDAQLSQQVVWERDARRAREAEELTRELGSGVDA